MSGPFVPLPLTAQIEMIFLQDGQVTENVYHVQGTAAWDGTSLPDLANQFLAWETTIGKNNRTTGVILTKIRARDMSTQFGIVMEVAESIPGTETSATLPNNATIAMKWTCGLAGRSQRGRTYHIGLPSDYLAGDGQHVSTTAVANLEDMYRYPLLHITFTNGGKLVVASRRHNNAWRTTGQLTPILDAVLSDTFVDSQRRRLPGHNRHR